MKLIVALRIYQDASQYPIQLVKIGHESVRLCIRIRNNPQVEFGEKTSDKRPPLHEILSWKFPDGKTLPLDLVPLDITFSIPGPPWVLSAYVALYHATRLLSRFSQFSLVKVWTIKIQRFSTLSSNSFLKGFHVKGPVKLSLGRVKGPKKFLIPWKKIHPCSSSTHTHPFHISTQFSTKTANGRGTTTL